MIYFIIGFFVYLFGIGFSYPIFVKLGWDTDKNGNAPPAELRVLFWPLVLSAYIVIVFPVSLGKKISSLMLANKNKEKPTTF